MGRQGYPKPPARQHYVASPFFHSHSWPSVANSQILPKSLYSKWPDCIEEARAGKCKGEEKDLPQDSYWHRCCGDSIQHNVGALTVRIGLWGILYYNHNKVPLNISIGNYVGSYITHSTMIKMLVSAEGGQRSRQTRELAGAVNMVAAKFWGSAT